MFTSIPVRSTPSSHQNTPDSLVGVQYPAAAAVIHPLVLDQTDDEEDDADVHLFRAQLPPPDRANLRD